MTNVAEQICPLDLWGHPLVRQWLHIHPKLQSSGPDGVAGAWATLQSSGPDNPAWVAEMALSGACAWVAAMVAAMALGRVCGASIWATPPWVAPALAAAAWLAASTGAFQEIHWAEIALDHLACDHRQECQVELAQRHAESLPQEGPAASTCSLCELLQLSMGGGPGLPIH